MLEPQHEIEYCMTDREQQSAFETTHRIDHVPTPWYRSTAALPLENLGVRGLVTLLRKLAAVSGTPARQVQCHQQAYTATGFTPLLSQAKTVTVGAAAAQYIHGGGGLDSSG